MKPYYGLRLIRTFFLALAIIICIAAVASLGTLFAISLFTESTFDLLQAFFILVTSGFIALLCSAFAQMIDLQLESHAKTEVLEAQLAEIKAQNTELMKLVQNLRVAGRLSHEPDSDMVQQQLEDRRKKLG